MELFMSGRLFEIFANTLDRLPIKGLRRAIELEMRMLEADVSGQRIPDDLEVKSILAFCRFVNYVSTGTTLADVKLPVAHVAYYRNLVLRLIEAGELPANAITQFDAAVGSEFWKTLKTNYAY